MADDIDIEEHDVLDNPRIKNIFPDIASIKTEVEDYVEEENFGNEEELEEYPQLWRQSINLVFEDSNDFESLPNKIIVGTKPSVSNTPETEHQNKIIIGSKICTVESSEESDPNDDFNELNLPEATVVLKDWKDFLDKNPCYCKPCKILFPTVNVLDAHKTTAHSFLVAVGNNKAMKSTSKNYTASRIKLEPPSIDRSDLTCNHCNVKFPNEIDLIKHTYELIPGQYECKKCNLVFENDSGYRVHISSHSSPNLFILCKICSCHFKLASKFGTHMRVNHQMAEVGKIKHVPTSFMCTWCGAKLKDSKCYNVHIQSSHYDIYTKLGSAEKISKFKCPQCNMRFSSDYSVRIHRAAKHGFVDKTNAYTTGILKGRSADHAFDEHRILPKSMLYKCNKCQIHFVSCVTALQHSRRCVLKKGEWKCEQCRRAFKLTDRIYHNYQHGMTDKFNVVEISEEVFTRILCRCTKCTVHFDERAILNHSESCSTKDGAVQCADCHIWVHTKSLMVHKKLHAVGLAFKDFIISDYVHSVISNTTGPRIVSADDISNCSRRLYFYCPTCKCFMQRNRRVDQHFAGQCNTDRQKFTCKLCGLRFTTKGLLSHKTHHKQNPKLKLRDLDFVNVQDEERMDPPFPDFKKCQRCSVRFFSYIALNNHVCNSEEPKICGYCNESFSDLAYNLHVPFHEYSRHSITSTKESIPELMKKYKSLKNMWNILFLCQTCDIVIDTYDKVVEHCQDHFRNMESYNVTIDHCKICNLKFVADSYIRHEKLHSSDDINKNSFTILEYRYETLLSDSWLDMFVTLTKEQVDIILSKSMYKFTRCVRMYTAADGPVELTLYQCNICELMVPPDQIVEHAQNQSSCAETARKFDCSLCRLVFAAKNDRAAHEELHHKRELDENSFRIIRFIAENQFSIDDGSLTDHPDELKFIRCQHCGKLINKKKYKGHIKYHNYYNRIKAERKVFRHGSMKQNTKAHPTTKTIVHNFYKCRDCNLCVSKKGIKAHYCVFDIPKKRCTQCSLWFRSQNIASHKKYHDRYPFNRSNINLTYFENGVIDKRSLPKSSLKTENVLYNATVGMRADNKMVFYQCTNCTLCIMKQVNIKRHVCTTSAHRITCNICNLTIFSSHYRLHKSMHDIKRFGKKNLVIYKFNNNKQSAQKVDVKPNDELVEKRKRLSSVLSEGTPAKRSKIMERRAVVRKLNAEVSVEKRTAKDVSVNKDTLNYELIDKEFYRQMSIRYFKCKECKLLFVTCSSLMAHEKSCREDRTGVKCSDCGLVFHTSMIHAHKALQKCTTKQTDQMCVVTVKHRGIEPWSDTNWIYWCQKCDIYSLSMRGLTYHFEIGHKYLRKMVKCNQCSISFSAHSYNKHVNIHHKNKISLSDLSIAIVEDTVFKAYLKELPDENDVRIELSDSIDEDNKEIVCESVDSEKTNDRISDYKDHQTDKVAGIYNCEICGLNFVNVKSLSAHKSYGRHDEVQYSCPECGLSFTEISLKRHTLLHHPKSLKRKENQLNQNSSGTEATSSVSNESITESISRMFVESQRDIGSNRTSSDVAHKDRVIEAVPDIFVEPSSTLNQSRSLPSEAPNQNKLFKCSTCDVYYLTEEACRDHISDHTALDPTEYIACKMCDFQFPCEHLGKHMKGHRENTFYIDDLIVVEYQPGADGVVRKDKYLAADRLKSKLVSTTTHSDTEEDKDCASVNCVDSTTENVPEGFEADASFEADTVSTEM